jgi:leucyl aminopeptidase
MRRSRGHGPGFIVHDSYRQARQALQQPRLDVLAKQLATPKYSVAHLPQIKAWLPHLQASNIVSTITTLSGFMNRYYTTSHGVAASNWVYAQWKQLAGARSDIRVEQITHRAWPQKSVMLTIQGSDPAAGIIVLGGHLDSTDGSARENNRAPGADDNASGIASLTEALRVLLANNYQPKRTIKFIAYAAEEEGLLGAKAIVKQFHAQLSDFERLIQNFRT